MIRNFYSLSELHVPDLNSHTERGIAMLHRVGDDWAFYNGGNRWTYGVYMYKAVQQFGMKFRLGWHWNATGGDPYYPLDCREDDYAWCNANADGELIPSLEFEREMRGGITDYRTLLTLARLAKEKHDAPAEALIAGRLGRFQTWPTRPRRVVSRIRLARIPPANGRSDRQITGRLTEVMQVEVQFEDYSWRQRHAERAYYVTGTLRMPSGDPN